jgi:hypothetical protein
VFRAGIVGVSHRFAGNRHADVGGAVAHSVAALLGVGQVIPDPEEVIMPGGVGGVGQVTFTGMRS